MPLRGKPPVVERNRPKILIFGEYGTGKTHTSLHFPKPYLIDTEEGIKYKQYVEIAKKTGAHQFKSRDIDEIYKEVKVLLTEKHDRKTLIIDSISKIYNNLAIESAEELRKIDPSKNPDGTAFGGHLKRAQNKLKPLQLLIERLDMNVIMIAHAKSKWKNNEQIGNTFDVYDKLGYDLDLMLETKLFGKSKRTATVLKSRIPEFPMLETFDWDYETFAKMYGEQYIDKDAKPEDLATPEQIAELNKWIEKLNLDEKIINKWLDKAKASRFEEMEKSKIQACIDHVKKNLEEK